MSVLRSKRHIAETEFEHTFSELYAYSMEHTAAVSKRRKKWLCTNIDMTMNQLFDLIMEVNEGYYPKEETQKAHDDLIGQSLDCLIKLEKPLMIMWNVESYETRKMAHWIGIINREIVLLNNMQSNKKKKPKQIRILDWKKINSVAFLKNMSNLNRYVHGKVIHAKNRYDDTEASLLIRLVDDAFYSLMEANFRIPETKKEYEDRRNKISHAISCLNKMNRPMVFYFNTMQYSERVMREWADMLANELKMLYALQKSDKSRFKHLQ